MDDQVVSLDQYVPPRCTSTDTGSVLLATITLMLPVVLTWYLRDSLYLRYVLLFVGVGISTHAVYHVLIHGVLANRSMEDGAQLEKSDFHLMADHYNRGRQVRPDCASRTKRIFAHQSV